MLSIRTAAACAVVAALPCAFAQPVASNVTLYGLVDTAIAHTNAGKGSVSSLESGVMLGSRVGFRGEETLSGKLKALYTLEMGLNNDTGGFGQGGLAFGRQAFVGLAQPSWGRLTLGRHYSVLHTHLATYTLGGLVWGNALNYFRDGSVLRLDNSLRYESPTFAGLSARLLYAFGEQADTSVGQAVNPSVNYANGPWQAGASYMRRNKAAGNVEHYASAGASIDLAWVKLALAYYRQRDELAAATSLSRQAFELSAMVPFGAHAVWLSYGKNHGQARPDTDAWAVSARYDYTLSKRTRLYAGYTTIGNAAQASFTVNSASNAGPAAANGAKVRQSVMGITHQF